MQSSKIDIFDVIIEINPATGPVKYEQDETSGLLRVDRFMPTSMHYPCNYGFIPQTIGGDGDPLDILLYSTHDIIPGAIVSSRAIGVLMTEDEKGQDSKILAVPNTKIDPMLSSVQTYQDLPEIFMRRIEHFFEHYKALERNKWVKVMGWDGPEEARALIAQSIDLFQNTK